MARLVKIEAKKPHKLEIGGEVKWICSCGLSKNLPFCDGNHKTCHDEDDQLYTYENGERKPVE